VEHAAAAIITAGQTANQARQQEPVVELFTIWTPRWGRGFQALPEER
jgi:hypothetical protein